MVWLRFLLLVLTLSTMAGAAVGATRIATLVVEQTAVSQEFQLALENGLRKLMPDAEVREFRTIDQALDWQPKAIVSVGMASLQQLRAGLRRPPVVAALVPRSSYERSALAAEPRTSAVFLDQPEERQLALLSLLPGRPRAVGLISSAASSSSLLRLRSAAQKMQFTLIEEIIGGERDVGQALTSVTGRADVLLALPDPVVFNSQTIQNVLLTSYRARVPLVGFSLAYTRAGAMLSLHSPIRSLAEQVAELVRVAAAGALLPSPQWPHGFEVSVNRQVARSLGVELPPDSVLAERLKQREAAP